MTSVIPQLASADSEEIPLPAIETNQVILPSKITKLKVNKKKKKIFTLYQSDAIKTYNGLIQNKRFKKGLSLTKTCMVFKTAWELPANNGLILPSRIIRHFKQILPKKSKQKTKTAKIKKHIITEDITSPSIPGTIETTDPSKIKQLQKSRSYTYSPVSSISSNIVSFSAALITEEEEDNIQHKTSTPVYDDQASIMHVPYDEHKDTEKQQNIKLGLVRSQSKGDIFNMTVDALSFPTENTMVIEEIIEEKTVNESLQKTKQKKKKKMKGASDVLYAEDAIKTFKRITDGKRFRNGLDLRKACKIHSIAWELPNENGRLLPSKVAKHFKKVLPSKKLAKKMNKNKPILKKSLTERIAVVLNKNKMEEQSPIENCVEYGGYKSDDAMLLIRMYDEEDHIVNEENAQMIEEFKKYKNAGK